MELCKLSPCVWCALVRDPDSYPARYRIPISTIRDLPLQEQVRRAEKFALGALLYELFAGRRIFEGLSDKEAEHYGKAATFPDLEQLPVDIQCLIYSCWSAEFGRYIALGKFRQYVHDNPVRFALQVTGAVVSIVNRRSPYPRRRRIQRS
jgi:hypothetical protein